MAYSSRAMTAEVVEDDDVARAELRQQELLDIGVVRFSIAAFGAWAAGVAITVAVNGLVFMSPRGVRYSLEDQKKFELPGSWVPLALMLAMTAYIDSGIMIAGKNKTRTRLTL